MQVLTVQFALHPGDMCQVCGQEQPMLCPLCEDLTWPMLSCHLQFNRVFTDVRPCVGICSMISAFSQAGLARCFGLRQHPAEPILRRPRAPRTSLPTCAGPAAQSPAVPLHQRSSLKNMELRCRVSAGAHRLRKDWELHAMEAWQPTAHFGICHPMSHACAGRTPRVPVTEPVTTLAEPTVAWRLLSSDLTCGDPFLDRDPSSSPRSAEFGDPFLCQVAPEHVF